MSLKKFSVLIFFIVFLTACQNNQLEEREHSNPPVEIEREEEPIRAPEPEPEPEPEIYTAKLTVVGDLMVHDVQLEDAYDPNTQQYSFDYSFEHVTPLLSRADYTIGNLETTLAGAENRGYTGYPEFNTPDQFAQALKNAGFNFLTTANNHSYDRRFNGLVRTIEVLDEIGIEHTGTFATSEAQNEVFMKEINGITFAIVSFTYGTNGIPVPGDKDFSINLLTKEVVKREIEEAKTLDPDVIIALPHMGHEYALYPAEEFQHWATFMLEAGADIVLASHPHVLQPVEYRIMKDETGEERKAFIAYSLGNFISSQRTVPRDAGMMLHLDFTKVEGEKAELTNVSFTPTWVQYRDRAGNYLIRVLPVYDVLKDIEGSKETFNLSNNDIERIKKVHIETTKMILNEEIPLSELQEKYVIPEHITLEK